MVRVGIVQVVSIIGVTLAVAINRGRVDVTCTLMMRVAGLLAVSDCLVGVSAVIALRVSVLERVSRGILVLGVAVALTGVLVALGVMNGSLVLVSSLTVVNGVASVLRVGAVVDGRSIELMVIN